ncbi:MAG: D-alanine--D-alanine ligase [Flavobacteriales bacterium]|nr:D-alanine--D-alanine ligase [Flavobacteriales bacterium]
MGATLMRIPIAVVRGGYSGESVISMQSAANMMAAVDHARFDPWFVTITPQGWSCSTPEEVPIPFDRGGFACVQDGHVIPFRMALIAIHGTPGENGLLQGYLDMLGIPYQTGGVLNMALTFSKHSTTAILREMGFRVAPSVLLTSPQDPMAGLALAQVGLPCFVKPDASGSSLGISKVKHASELKAALEVAFKECDAVMVEGAVQGRELTCGVIAPGAPPQALPVCEIVHSHEFFDYEAKYHATDTREIVPASIPDAVAALCQERSVAIFKALRCRGMARVDHIWTGDELVTIEVNTTPGFTAASILPKMLAAAGIAPSTLVNALLTDALQPAR